ncbi:hypothetical protein ACQUD0_04500 [Vagococcus fluvialis]|uniref:hypothetical protein n=1 Tax=Vagococcus fluvialis TaxID=2738 RepID=UPI001432840E|nr:hypothetical protein [Vagococcus fluvialis]NKC58897.1 hypothetical protein [Vagococcus fluvialis]NKD49651.1 hypothetical protein [Vagococcus fluvialis]
MTLKHLLYKDDFMEKYRLKPTKYAERMDEVRLHPEFKECYIEVTGKEIWIDEEIYQEFLIWKAQERIKNKFK